MCFTVSAGKKPPNETHRIFPGLFPPRRSVKALPKRTIRPLFASAEKGPTHAPFVILRPGERERHKRDKPFMRKVLVKVGEFTREVRIPLQYRTADSPRRQVLIETLKAVQYLPCHQSQAGLYFLRLFTFAD
jgi:hypothetical protein